MVRHFATAALLAVAVIFALLATLGAIRSKNNFAALHCVGVVNVLVPPFTLVGVIVATGFGVSSLKMLVLAAIIMLGGPIGSHAIAVAEHRRKPQ